jgi:hypothetical protein
MNKDGHFHWTQTDLRKELTGKKCDPKVVNKVRNNQTNIALKNTFLEHNFLSNDAINTQSMDAGGEGA